MARRAPRVYAAHSCPRCGSMTTTKDYCRPCLDVLRKPPMGRKRSFWPDWKEQTLDRKRMRT